MRGIFENTFQNGLSSDYNIVLQPDGTYRYMKNCQLVSQDGNNFVVKDCLGNVVTFSLNRPYNAVYTVPGDYPRLLALISFPNKLISFTTTSLDGGPGEIGMLEYLPYGDGVQPKAVAGEYNAGYIPLYHEIGLHFSQKHKIKGFSFIENELIERVYWTDFFNEPRTFNVSDPIFTNYIPTGSLVTGNKYMVLEGAITHSAVNYGPGLTDGNVFTAANANYTALTGTAPTPKVIDYFPVSLLDFTPYRTLGNIIFDEYGSGSLYCGSKVYYYRLGKNSGVVTSWSYGSSPVPVGTLNDSDDLTVPTVAYHDFVGGGTPNILLDSTLSVWVNIENVDTDFDYIELAAAEFDESINTPRLISIVNSTPITGTTMRLEHTGGVNLGTLTIGDITLFPASILKVKTLATNKNFMLGGNFVERQEFDIDLRLAGEGGTVTAASFQYPMNVHFDALSCTFGGMVYSGASVAPVSGANPSATFVYPFSRWLVIRGEASVNTVVYNGTTYFTGDIITGVTGAGNSTITFAGAGAVRPCVNKNRYTTNTSDPRPNAIEIKGTNPSNTCFWDYKSAAAAHHVTGYWSNEIYRFGILFYDLKGNPFYVKFLFDYQFPPATFKSGIIRRDQIAASGNYVYSLNPSGLNVGGIIIPADIIDRISGFSIVRAERDARIVTQGLVTQCAINGSTVVPGAWNPMSKDGFPVADKTYSYICPDVLVDVPLKKTIGIPGDTMEEASWVDPFDYGGGIVVRGQGVADSEQVYTKYLSCLNDGSIRTGTLASFATVFEAGTSPLGNGNTFANSALTVGGAVTADVKGSCVAGTTDYVLDGHKAVGGKKSVFRLDADFLSYGPSANGYTSNTDAGIKTKILMNYVKSGFSDPYGGTGDGAKANTLYISTGHFQPITTQVKLETINGSGDYEFNDIEIFGGDCFVNLVDYGYGLWNNDYVDKYSYAWTFPCENNANYDLRRGRKTSNVEMYYTGTVLTQSIVYLPPVGLPKLEDFSYNQGYSTEGQDVVYPALPVNFVNSGEFQARIRYAGPKFSGETIDSFRTFAITDFKDLSYNYGRINDINVKDDKVIVWQDLAISTVPVLERQVVSGIQGDATTIGTGGVVDRFDVISSFFGTQHQWSITETEYGFAFFDMNRKAFVILSFAGDGLLEVSQVYGLKAFFDEVFIEIEGSTSSTESILINSPVFADTQDHPVADVGVISAYDPKFKMTYMCFKFYGQKASPLTTISKDFTIGYLHTNTKKCFVGFFDWNPYIMYNHNGIVISANNPKNNTQFLGADLTGKSFIVGDTLWGASTSPKQKEYINIFPVTLDNVDKYPEGAQGNSYWVLVNTVNQLWVHNQPTLLNQTTVSGLQYNKFFGKVVNNEIIPIINPQDQGDAAFEVQNISQNGPFNVNYTDIYIDADNQSAADLSITGTNRNYRFIYDKITSNLPFSSTGRIINKYLRLRFVKKNYTTNPTILTTSVKILRSITSYFVNKR